MTNARHHDSAARLAMRRLLDAIDRAVSVAREVELARAALDRAVAQPAGLRIVSERGEGSDADQE
jgi:hypothetical protein